MAEEKTKPVKEEMKTEKKKAEAPKTEVKKETPQTEKPKMETTEKKTEIKTEDKKKEESKTKETKKKKEEPKVKKYEAIARGTSLHISTKQAKYICSFIKNKEIDKAIRDLQKVVLLKKAVPFKGEIPHRKGKGMMSGRYPVKASKIFINMLKALKGNVIVNGMELEKTKISIASASQAARPAKRSGGEAKRTHVILKAKEIASKKTKKKSTKKEAKK